MKTNSILFFIAFFFPAITLYSQTYEVEYYYDAAGNRIEREIIYLPVNYASSQFTSNEQDTLHNVLSENLSVDIYPNPVLSVLHVKLNGKCGNVFFSVFNNNGKQLNKGQLNKGENSVSFENFASGIYYLKIIRNDRTLKNYKIVKQ